MPTVHNTIPGNFCWFELGTRSLAGAKEFYTRMFGWTCKEFPIGPAEVYAMFQLDGLDVGAAFEITPDRLAQGDRSNWLPYIAVNSADQTAGRIAAAGGKLLKAPFEVMTFGRMAVARDPQGAVFAIWEPKDHIGIAVSCESGAYCWGDLSTTNPARAADFYRAVFDWSIDQGHDPPSNYLHVWAGKELIAGIQPKEGRNAATAPHWLTYFQCDDCDGLTRKARDLGAAVQLPPISMPNVGRFSVIADPQGAVFALFELPDAA